MVSPLDVMRLELTYSEHAERVRAAERDYWIKQALTRTDLAAEPWWAVTARQRWRALLTRREPGAGLLRGSR